MFRSCRALLTHASVAHIMPPAPLRPYLTQVESKGSASKPPTPLNPPAGATAARTLSAKRNGTGSAAAAASARVRRAIFQDDDAPDATEIERHAPAAAGSLNPRIEAISPSPRVSGSLHESPLLSPVKTAAVTAGGGATTVDGGGGGGDGGRGNAESLAARMPSVAGMVKGQAAAEEEREGTDGIGFGVGFGVGVDGGVFGGGTAGREGKGFIIRCFSIRWFPHREVGSTGGIFSCL